MFARTLFSILGGVIGALVAVFGVTHLQALAESDGSSATDALPRMMPYEGTLSADGVAYDGAVDLKFVVTDDDKNVLWSETHEAVAVDAGRFWVPLGTLTAADTFEALFQDAETLFLQVEVRADASAGWTALAGRQFMGAAATALWAPQASDLIVTEGVEVTGTTSVGNLSAAGSLNLDGSAADLEADPEAVAETRLSLGEGTAGPHGFAFADDDLGGQFIYRSSPNQILIEPDNSFDDGTNYFTLDVTNGNVSNYGWNSIAGSLTIEGALTIDPADSGLAVTGALATFRIGSTSFLQKTLRFAPASGKTGMRLVYSTTSGDLNLQTDAGSSFAWLRDNGDVETAIWDFNADGDRIIVPIATDLTISTNLDSSAEYDYDKLSSDFTGCTNGAVTLALMGGSPGICTCTIYSNGNTYWSCLR